MKPRPYQTESLEAVIDEFAKVASTLLVLPTGCGKTIVFSILADMILDHHPGMRAIVLAHRRELIDQACDKIRRTTSRTTEIEMAEQYAVAGSDSAFNPADILVSSIQTQCSGKPKPRMQRFLPGDFSLLIADEAHRAVGAQFRRVFEWYQANRKLKLLGVTATPDRHDEEALGQVFESVAYCYELQDAIRDGWLVPIAQRSITVDGLDFSDVRKTAGDLNGQDLENVLMAEKPLHGMAEPTLKELNGRKALVFCVTVAHAQRMAEIFNRHVPGIAREIHGKTPKKVRRQTLDDYSRGDFKILCNVGVLTEGYDEESIEAIVMARPTLSRGLFAQMVGRGTRTMPGGMVDLLDTPEERRNAIFMSPKEELLIIDFVGNTGRHKLRHAVDLLGGNYSTAVIERARGMLDESEQPEDVEEILKDAAREVEKEIEEERRKMIKAKVRYRVEIIRPFDVLDVRAERQRAWDRGIPGSEKQLAFLRGKGVIVPDDGFTKREASQLIGEIIERSKNGLGTYKQVQKLVQNGHPAPQNLTFEEASRCMNELVANDWRPPDSWLATTG